MPESFFFYSDIKDYVELNIKFTNKIFKIFLDKLWSYFGFGINENTCYSCGNINNYTNIINHYKKCYKEDINRSDNSMKRINKNKIEEIIFIDKKRQYLLNSIKNKQECEYFIRILNYLEVIITKYNQ